MGMCWDLKWVFLLCLPNGMCGRHSSHLTPKTTEAEGGPVTRPRSQVSFRGRKQGCTTPGAALSFLRHTVPSSVLQVEGRNTYCSSALRSNHSESVTRGGPEGGVCADTWSSLTFPGDPPRLAPVVPTPEASCCLSPVSFLLARARSSASFTNNMLALHALPPSGCFSQRWSPTSHSPVCEVLISSSSSPLTVDPSGCRGWISRATRGGHRLLCVSSPA